MTINIGKKILVIEDEHHIAEGIKLNLSLSGHEVFLAENGRIGLKLFDEVRPDLIVVDLMMPEIDGVGVIKKIREKFERVPILVISAKDHVDEKVKCLRLGVDDYLSKPFHLDEFLLRVERLMTRSDWNIVTKRIFDDEFKFGSNIIVFSKLKAITKSGEYDLTLQEIKLLKYFIENKNVILSREKILEEALGYDPETSTRTLDNFIVRFRKYFESDPKNPEIFKSVRSIGYLFDIKS
jgi:two-component system alkaline phosphatase synthesis response regulator PhoP